MSRWKAAAIHFSISLLVFLFLLTLILWLWYPGILFSIDGGWSGLRLVIGVDLLLGPLLTLVVFKSGKPGRQINSDRFFLFPMKMKLPGLKVI